MHGGKSLAGPAAPRFTTGRHSRYLPKHLLADYLASRADPDRLALEDELALIDARINDLLRVVETGESGRLWAELRQTVRELETAQRRRNTASVAAAVGTLAETVKRGHEDALAWAEVMTLIERRRKLVDSERKRLVDAQQMISSDQALALMGLLVDAVKRHVTDPAALRAVVETFTRLAGRPVPSEPSALPVGNTGRLRWDA